MEVQGEVATHPPRRSRLAAALFACGRGLIFVSLIALVALGWWAYANTPFLIDQLPRHLDIYLIYARWCPVDLDDPDVFRRAVIAFAIALAALGLLYLRPPIRFRTGVQLALAVAGICALNAAVAHIRDGSTSFENPFSRRNLEYYTDLPRVGEDPVAFARDYHANPRLSHHARTHPPGGVLFLWAGSQVFGPSISAAAWWAVAFTALGILPAYLLARTLNAPHRRHLALLYLVTPSLVIFGATCMDGVFLVFILASLATAFRALHHPTALNTVVAGVSLWLAAFMSFSAVAVPVLMSFYLLFTAGPTHRSLRGAFGTAFAIGLTFIIAQLVVQRLTGYDFIATAEAAMGRDLYGMGRDSRFQGVTEWLQITGGNLVAFFAGTGLTVTALLLMALAPPRLATARTLAAASPLLRPFAWAVAATIVALAASTLFTMETERVWLFMAPPLLVAVLPQLRPGVIVVIALITLLAQALATELIFYTYW